MKPKLICFDLDGTLVDETIFIWQTIHEFFETSPVERKAMAENFFSGKITYPEWAEWEINTWIKKGADKELIFKAIEPLVLMEGAKETIDELKKRGYKLAIISGSLSFVLDKLIPDYEDIFSDVLINKIVFGEDGKIKEMDFTEYDMAKKAEGLKMIAQKHGFSVKDCMFVGDHNNDIEIAKLAGFAIAFNSKSETLNEISDTVIKKKDLREILRLID